VSGGDRGALLPLAQLCALGWLDPGSKGVVVLAQMKCHAAVKLHGHHTHACCAPLPPPLCRAKQLLHKALAQSVEEGCISSSRGLDLGRLGQRMRNLSGSANWSSKGSLGVRFLDFLNAALVSCCRGPTFGPALGLACHAAMGSALADGARSAVQLAYATSVRMKSGCHGVLPVAGVTKRACSGTVHCTPCFPPAVPHCGAAHAPALLVATTPGGQ